MKTTKYFLWPVGERVQLIGAGSRWHGLEGAVVGHVRLEGVKLLAVRLNDGSGLTVISHPEIVMSRELK